LWYYSLYITYHIINLPLFAPSYYQLQLSSLNPKHNLIVYIGSHLINWSSTFIQNKGKSAMGLYIWSQQWLRALLTVKIICHHTCCASNELKCVFLTIKSICNNFMIRSVLTETKLSIPKRMPIKVTKHDNEINVSTGNFLWLPNSATFVGHLTSWKPS